ncbi:hypothetical protein BUZ80_10860 [Staphylococcus saprophyticus]|uniref:Uncharacterized protein n=1 Tax=Staphylococcus shinii TaxID=2912228 RepID=A0A418IGT0_9STAP|nr:hypothetical protein U918_02215 [Staphylococcus aureus 10S01493]PTF21984.1 hypothetical protein BUY40_00280 [Staphylococcus cohnii]RIN01605.1 hypothetical protein BU112_05155 [Staphylococcus shinii]RIO28101.1 hypothetical protein BUZ80_10860 [Staphylococcus saprophyticus]
MRISECKYLCIKKDNMFEKGKLYWLFPTKVSTLNEDFSYVSNQGQLLTEEYKNNNFIKTTLIS